MYEMPVRGEIRTLGFREGSSGIFTGSIEGLYQGYRFASATPDRRPYKLEAPNGTIAVELQQQIMTLLPARLAEHPFANGRDPYDLLPSQPTIPAGGGRPPVRGPHGALPFGETDSSGPPEGLWPAGGGPPAGLGADVGPAPERVGSGPAAGIARPAAMHTNSGVTGSGPPAGDDAFARANAIHYMEVTLHVEPHECAGIFAGATGALQLQTPAYEMAGYLVVNTPDGDLHLDFMETGDMGSLKARLTVDGAKSTGVYRNATGDLRFELARPKPMYGRGPYWGTIRLENPPQAT